MNLLPPDLLTFMDTNNGEKAVLPAPIKRPKYEPLSDAINRFGSSVTGTDTLTTFSKGFVLENNKLNT